MKDVCIENRKAKHDYFIEDSIECGIALRGNEVKSIRKGMCSIKESWGTIQNGNLILRRMHIAKYDTANAYDVDEYRERQLLVHKREIRKLEGKVSREGITLIPIKVYFKNGKCKVLLGICKGKHFYDKREALKKRQVQRDIDRALRNRFKEEK